MLTPTLPSTSLPALRLSAHPQIWAFFIFASGLYALLSGSAQIGMACYLLIQGERRGDRWSGGLQNVAEPLFDAPCQILPAPLPTHPPSHPPALLPFLPGFVFLAFGFNWVDAGGLLGGRLDEDIVRVPASAKVRW